MGGKLKDLACNAASMSDHHVIRLGCAGWNVPKQHGLHFEAEGSHLQRYSRGLNACEVNSSFYRSHRKETWERWAATVPCDFQFAVKVPKTITHIAWPLSDVRAFSAFLVQVSALGRKLGVILFQFPPSVAYERVAVRRYLQKIRGIFAGEVAWEPRNASWFNETVDDVLNEFRIARVAADPACVPAAALPGGSPTTAYFRLHGAPRRHYSAYPSTFLRTKASELANLSVTAKVWCIFDNTAAGFAIPNALELKEHLGILRSKSLATQIDVT